MEETEVATSSIKEATEQAKILRFEKLRQQEMAEKALRKALLQIVKLVNSKNSSHIPPVNLNSETTMVFQFEISIPNEASKSRTAEFWFSKVNQALMKGPDPGFMSM